ncbi:hypothetical protein F5146DRAFT_1151969 [Armillaria mellea]|nr:hypothetical protein F5146DRAFT_1151969 [Armillaria mellea]
MLAHHTPKDDAALQHKSLCTYESAASQLAHKIEFLPLANDIATLDAWVKEAYSQWAVCDQFWQRAGIKKKVSHDLEFRLVEVIDNIDQDDIGDSQAEFNVLASRAHEYGVPVRLIPLPRQTSPSHRLVQGSPTSPIATPTPPSNPPVRTMAVSSPAKSTSSLSFSKPQQAGPSSSTLKIPKPGPPSQPILQVPNPSVAAPSTILESNQFSATFKENESSFRAPILLQSPTRSQTVGQSAASGTLSTLLTVNAASHARVFPGPDPTRVDEGSGPSTPSKHESLFFAGMDDDNENADNNKSFDESTGATVIPSSAAATVPMVFDQIVDDDTATSPPPATSVWRHCQPIIKFMFDDVTGDFLEAHLTIFLTRPPSQDQDKEIEPHRSTWPHILPPTLNVPQNPMDKGTKKHKTPRSTSQDKKDSKGKEKTGVSLKRTRFANEEVPAGDQPATKKSKGSKGMVAVCATPIVQKRGPGLSKLPPVSLGVSGGGFGENVSKDFEPIDDDLKSVGVLVVEADYGISLWLPLLGNDTRRLAISARAAKPNPCTISGDTILNPMDHYHPKGSSEINAFESALNALEQSNQAISSLMQQYLASLNVLAHTESIQVQVSCLRACLPSNEDDEDNLDGVDGEDDEIEEGVTGPSSQKSQSG